MNEGNNVIDQTDFQYAQPQYGPTVHLVLATSILPPFPNTMSYAVFGMGCFWGAERMFWQAPGVYTTAVGYAGGHVDDPGYHQVCSGNTGHAEVVLVVFNAQQGHFNDLLKIFWEAHNPTQGMRQGNDRGSQYRSVIYTYGKQQYDRALLAKANYQQQLQQHQHTASITTEIKAAPIFYYAEDYHQQYLAKNPNGYCGLSGTGVCYQTSDNSA